MKTLKEMKNQKGFSLIELLIVVAVVLIGIAIVGTQGRELFGASKVDRSSRDAQNIAMAVKKQFGATGQIGFTGLTTQVAIDMGATPDYMEDSAATLTNSWGGTVVIDTADLEGAGATNIAGVADADSIQILFTGIAGDDCAAFANAIGGMFTEVRVSSTATPADGALVKTEEDDGADAVAVAGQCDDAVNTNSVQMRLL